jgi:hypothetical protein
LTLRSRLMNAWRQDPGIPNFFPRLKAGKLIRDYIHFIEYYTFFKNLLYRT